MVISECIYGVNPLANPKVYIAETDKKRILITGYVKNA